MRTARTSICPFLMPVVNDGLWLHPLGVYCRRPDGRVRAPARSTILSICTTAQHRACASYRAAVAVAPRTPPEKPGGSRTA